MELFTLHLYLYVCRFKINHYIAPNYVYASHALFIVIFTKYDGLEGGGGLQHMHVLISLQETEDKCIHLRTYHTVMQTLTSIGKILARIC